MQDLLFWQTIFLGRPGCHLCRLRRFWGNLEALTGIWWPLQVEQGWLAWISYRAVHDLGPRRQFVRFDFAAGKDVLNGDIVRPQVVAEQVSVAMPVIAFGAHDGCTMATSDLQ